MGRVGGNEAGGRTVRGSGAPSRPETEPEDREGAERMAHTERRDRSVRFL